MLPPQTITSVNYGYGTSVLQPNLIFGSWNVTGYNCNGVMSPLGINLTATQNGGFSAIATSGNSCIARGQTFFSGSLPSSLNSPINVNVLYGNTTRSYTLQITGLNSFSIPQLGINFIKA